MLTVAADVFVMPLIPIEDMLGAISGECRGHLVVGVASQPRLDFVSRAGRET